jgi:hypothetical protein
MFSAGEPFMVRMTRLGFRLWVGIKVPMPQVIQRQ